MVRRDNVRTSSELQCTTILFLQEIACELSVDIDCCQFFCDSELLEFQQLIQYNSTF